MTIAPTPRPVTFIKGANWHADDSSRGASKSPYELAKSDFNEVLSSKNLTFLLGSGCSSHKGASGREEGIPTMASLAQGILAGENYEIAEKYGIDDGVKQTLYNSLGIDLEDSEYFYNLERLMEVLFGFQFALAKSLKESLADAATAVDAAINSIKSYILDVCRHGHGEESSSDVLGHYQAFYRKLSQRSRSLPRPAVATTNYDLFNEIAMDRLGVPYINGFMGSVERIFNPASFRYTIAQRLDTSSQRWTSLDNLVYFLKLHGSLNWHSTNTGLFPVEERPLSESADRGAGLIYPTPAKQNASFAAPYSDMFREFQSKVVQEQSALVVVGYSFGDEHVNNIIYQALTVPTFRLVIFTKPEVDGESGNAHVKQLQDLGDPRIWIIGSNEAESEWKAHYFKEFVEDIMPAGEVDAADEAVDKVRRIAGHSKEEEPDGDE